MDIIQVENFKITDATASEKPLDNRGKNIFEKESVPTEHILKRKWAIPDESDNLSKDIVELFHAGDSAFCYSARTTGEEYITHFHPALRKIAVYFTALLVTIRYWKETRRPEASITFGMNDEFINSSNALNDNDGVFVCMLMEHLVTRKPLNLTADFNSYCISYRQFMAEQLYFWRS
ncbi:hypothetical protein R6Q57_018880 [Mikania cordata]